MSDLSFETGQYCLVNSILSDKQLIFKCHGEITETQFAVEIKVQGLQFINIWFIIMYP